MSFYGLTRDAMHHCTQWLKNDNNAEEFVTFMLLQLEDGDSTEFVNDGPLIAKGRLAVVKYSTMHHVFIPFHAGTCVE